MQSVEVGTLPPFGVNNAIGAFTQAPYPNTLWIITGTNPDGKLHCYNIVQRSFEDFDSTTQVFPVLQFNLTCMQEGGKMTSFIGN